MLFVRADGGTEMGLGHLMRSATLAHEWIARGGSVTFISARGSPPGPAASAGITATWVDAPYPDPRDLRAVSGLVGRHPGSWVVCDGYHFDDAYRKGLRRVGVRVLAVDDGGQVNLREADGILNQNLGAQDLGYRSEPLLLLGTRFALLRPEFRAWHGRRRTVVPRAKQIVVMLGGADHANHTREILDIVGALTRDAVAATAIIGPSNPHWPALRPNSPLSTVPSVTLLRDPPDLVERMASADLAIAAAGTTTWELCCLGVPTILVVAADNQHIVANALRDEGAALSVGAWNESTAQAIGRAVTMLIADPERRASMSQRASRLVDGWGASRVVDALLST